MAENSGLSCNFNILGGDRTMVVLRDTGPWDQYKTITNDAEAVVEHFRPRQVLYYDSEGELTEIVVDGEGKVVGFRTVNRVKMG
jgi:hypothetical protein